MTKIIESGHKLLVIGLDGGTFDLVTPWANRGQLPHLARLINEGVSGNLQSTMPPVTGPAWTSFMTGVYPGKHGIFSFLNFRGQGPERRINNSGDIQSNTLWSILSEYGLKVGAINVPVTYPPPEVNGFLVSGQMLAGKDWVSTNPPSLAQEIKKRFGKYSDIQWGTYKSSRLQKFMKRITALTEKRGRIIQYLMQKYEWDFLAAVFTGTDRIHHVLWQQIDPNSDCCDPEIEDLVLEYYQRLDKIIGDLIAKAGENVSVVIMSDHGFGPLHRIFFINKWLSDAGFLTWNEDQIKSLKFHGKREVLRLELLHWLRPLVQLRRKLMPKRQPKDVLIKGINWQKTKAYAIAASEQGIYLNLIGRDRFGIVRPGQEYETVRDEIIEALLQIREPSTGKRLVSHIFKKEDIYHGPFIKDAPDIIFSLKEGEYLAHPRYSEVLIQQSDAWNRCSGSHRMEGIFIAQGSLFKRGIEIDGARIIDLAPTFLYLMKVPIPEDMDGRILTEIFDDDFIQSYLPEYSQKEDKYERTAPLSQRDTEIIKEKLKGLGYLD